MRLKRAGSTMLVVLSALLLTWTGPASSASKFRKEFISNYISNRFQVQVMLVKKNKDIIPEEVKALISEAMAEGKTYEQRMYLLDIAQAMASMHKHWNGDDAPLIEVETLLKMLIHKENKRKAEIEKWKKYERFLGNFVMMEHKKQMEAEGVTPVIYPHWIHRIWYECKVCHQDLFVMHRGANDISHKHIDRGDQCGACHNGETAFGTLDREHCAKCHIAETPEVDRLYNVKNVDHEKLKAVAERVGAKWKPENLENGQIPLDRFGNIDWLEMKERNAFEPKVSLEEEPEDEILDDYIIFESTSPAVNNVLFSHKVHSTWIKCSSCHPDLFEEELGTNPIKMKYMAEGRYCGRCHGRVSFTFADCLRCHSLGKDETVEGALLRKSAH